MAAPMAIRHVIVCSALHLAVWLGTVTVPAAAAEPRDHNVDLSIYAWADPAETAALLEELNRSGMAPVAADLEQLGIPIGPAQRLGRPVIGRPPVRSGRRSRWRGSLDLHRDLRDARLPRLRVRLILRGPGVQAAVRLQRVGGERVVAAGYLVAERPRWRFLAGTIGWHHGFGLICAGPSRWRSLSATASLAPGSAGPSGTYAVSQRRTVLGSEIGWWNDTLEVSVLAGSVGGAAGRDSPVMWGRVSGRGTNARGSLLVGRAAGGDGFSLSGAWRHGVKTDATLRIEADVELAVWRRARSILLADQDRRLAPLWSARVRVIGRHGLLEGQIAGSRTGTAPPFGLRPAALPRHDGSGWAVRGRWKPTGATVVAALLAGSRVRESIAAIPADRRRATFGVAFEVRPVPGWRLTLDYRWRGSSAAAIAASEPWVPPREVQRQDRRLLAAHLRRYGDGWMCLLGLRTMVDSGRAVPRRRSLLESRGEIALTGNWLLRVGWSAAWGADVDLVGVAAPLPGLSTLRHWGRWREELICGLQRLVVGWHWQLAVSLRRPDRSALLYQSESSAPPATTLRELWVRGTYKW